MLHSTPLSRYIAPLNSLRRKWRNQHSATTNDEADNVPLSSRLLEVFLRTWDLGFTAFGGPPVHFQILYARFVEGKGGKEAWVDEQTVISFHKMPAIKLF